MAACESWGRVSAQFEELLDALADRATKRDLERAMPPKNWARSWKVALSAGIARCSAQSIGLALRGTKECAEWVAKRLPELLAQQLKGVEQSAAIKEAVKAAFLACDAELLAIQRQSGWDVRDSPVVALPPRASGSGAGRTRIAPVLTGNAWHWGRQQCPRECVANEGVCLPDVGRCDCPRHRWGSRCEVHVQPALARTAVHHGWCVDD